MADLIGKVESNELLVEVDIIGTGPRGLPGPKGDPGDVTAESIREALGYTPADNATAMEYKVLGFNGSAFLDESGNTLDFATLHELCLDKKNFVYVSYSNRLYIPQYINTNNVWFEAAYIDNEVPYMHRLGINSRNSVNVYTKALAVKSDMDAAKESIATLEGDVEELNENKADKAEVAALEENKADKTLKNIEGVGEVETDVYLSASVNGQVIAYKGWDISKYYPVKAGKYYALYDGTTIFTATYSACYDTDFNADSSIVTKYAANIYGCNRDGYIRNSAARAVVARCVFNEITPGEVAAYPKVGSATNETIDRRETSAAAITPKSLDYAVKAAMCDGKGAAWTDAEQAAALERIGGASEQSVATLAANVLNKGTLEFTRIPASQILPNMKCYVTHNNVRVEIPKGDAARQMDGYIEYNRDKSIINFSLKSLRFNQYEYGYDFGGSDIRQIDFGEIIPDFRPSKAITMYSFAAMEGFGSSANQSSIPAFGGDRGLVYDTDGHLYLRRQPWTTATESKPYLYTSFTIFQILFNA